MSRDIQGEPYRRAMPRAGGEAVGGARADPMTVFYHHLVKTIELIPLLFRLLHLYFLQDKKLARVNHPIFQIKSYQIHE